MDKNQLEQEFHKAMLNIYQEALNLPQPYKATRFLQIVNEFGGKEAADKLLSTGGKEDSDRFYRADFEWWRSPRLEIQYGISGVTKAVV